MVSASLKLAHLPSGEFSFLSPPRKPTRNSAVLPPLPPKSLTINAELKSLPSTQYSPLTPRSPLNFDSEDLRKRQIHDYYTSSLEVSLSKCSPHQKRISGHSRKSSTDTAGSFPSTRLSYTKRLSSGSIVTTPSSVPQPKFPRDIPTDNKTRSLWFLETIGTAPDQVNGTSISPSIYLPPKFWEMAITDSEVFQQLENRIKLIKKVLKHQSGFENEFERLSQGLLKVTQVSLDSHRQTTTTTAPPTPPMEGKGPRRVASGKTLEDTSWSVSTGFRSFSRSQSKADALTRYAQLAMQLYEAVKREYAFGLETAFVDFVLDTLVPCMIDDFFDLHALFIKSVSDVLHPELNL